MLRRLILPALAAGFVFSTQAGAQVRVADPPDVAEALEDDLSGAYYSGFQRAQRPIVDRVPERSLSGTGYGRINVRYFRGVGTILTDLEDKTLYATSRDRQFEKSSLTGEDLKAWQPIVVSEKITFTGLWGRAWNESLQQWVLTLVDKPLYRFNGDEEPGEVNGKGAGFYPLEVVGG